MADRRDLKQLVINLIENGYSASEPGRRSHVPLRTAQRWPHKFQNYEEFQRRYSTGRLRCSTMKEDPFRSANQIRAVVNFPGTSRTVMNRLRDAHIHCQRAVSKDGLTERQAVDRLAFATGWRDFDWGSVIFIDESSISSDCESGDTFIVSQSPDMTHAIFNDVKGREDLANHAGSGCLVLASAC